MSFLRFSSTEEAIEYGKNNPDEITELEKLRLKKVGQHQVLMEIIHTMEANEDRKILLNLLIEVATDGQFYREAIEGKLIQGVIGSCLTK